MNALLGALKSKTIWFGLAQVLLGASVTYFHDTLLPLVQGNPAATLIVTGAGTMLLRALSTTSLADKVKPTP